MDDSLLLNEIQIRYKKLATASNYALEFYRICHLVKSLNSDEAKLYVGTHISSELMTKEVIFSIKRNSRKIKALKLNPDAQVARSLRTTDSISTLLIKKEIKTFIRIELGDSVSEKEIDRKAELLLQLEEKNGGLSKKIDFRLLDYKYIGFLGRDRLSYLGLFKEPSNQLLNLTNTELKVLKKLYHAYFKKYDSKDWDVFLKQMMNGIYFWNSIQRQYNDYLKSIGQMPHSDSFFDNIDLKNMDVDNFTQILLTNYPTFLKNRIINSIVEGRVNDIDQLQKMFLSELGNPLDTEYPTVYLNKPLKPHCILRPDGLWQPCVIDSNGKINEIGKPSDFTNSAVYSCEFIEKKYGKVVGLFRNDGVFQDGADVEYNDGIYYAVVHLNNGEKIVDSSFNDYDSARNRALYAANQIEKYGFQDEIDKITNSLSVDELKELIFFKAFGIPLYEDKDLNFTLDNRKGIRWILNAYGRDIDKLDDSPYKKMVQTMKLIYEVNDAKELKKIYKGILKPNHIDVIQLESKLKKEYLKLYNKVILDPKTLPKNSDGFYETGDNFFAILSTLGAYSNDTNDKGDALERWNRKELGSQHFCTSLISNNMLGCAFKEGKVCVGFNNLDPDSFKLSGSLDMGTSNDKIYGLSNHPSRMVQFLSPETMIDSTFRYNELDFRRNQHGAKNNPSYIVIFKVDGEYKNLEESKKMAESFHNLPIVAIDVNKYLEKNERKLYLLDKQFINAIANKDERGIISLYDEITALINSNINTIKTHWKEYTNQKKRFSSWYKHEKMYKKDYAYIYMAAKNNYDSYINQSPEALQKLNADMAVRNLLELNIFKGDGTLYSISFNPEMDDPGVGKSHK